MPNLQTNINKESLSAAEESIRAEFAIAWDERDRASPADKPQAESRLNRAVRRLVDFIAYRKV